jgi:hypothetical protein
MRTQSTYPAQTATTRVIAASRRMIRPFHLFPEVMGAPLIPDPLFHIHSTCSSPLQLSNRIFHMLNPFILHHQSVTVQENIFNVELFARITTLIRKARILPDEWSALTKQIIEETIRHADAGRHRTVP